MDSGYKEMLVLKQVVGSFGRIGRFGASGNRFGGPGNVAFAAPFREFWANGAIRGSRKWIRASSK